MLQANTVSKSWHCRIRIIRNKAFWNVETLFIQGNIFVLDQNKPPCLVIKKRLTIVNLFYYYQTRRFVLIQYEDINLDE